MKVVIKEAFIDFILDLAEKNILDEDSCPQKKKNNNRKDD